MRVKLPRGNSLTLSVQPIEKLLPHERVIPSLLASVKRDLARTGFQRDPLIIDRRTKVVLDGMHRRKALSSLGAVAALCAEYDYLSKSVKLQRWLRYFIAPDKEFVGDLISLFKLEKAKSFRSAIRSVDSNVSNVALLSNKESFTGGSVSGLIASYLKLSKFDDLARRRKVEVQFHPEDEMNSLFTADSVYVLYPAFAGKRLILRLAEARKLLPFKTTRHLVPARPMGVFFPLNLLKQSNLDVCNQALKECIEKSRIELLEKESWYEGRRYSDRVAVFRRF